MGSRRQPGERIYYIIPEDGDDEAHPNYFMLPGPSGLEVKLNDVKHFFPFGGANFHFRFLQLVGGMRAWVDLSEDTAAVPRFEGAVVFKASRLQIDDESRLGGLKQFMSNLGVDSDEASQPVGKLKAYLSKATTGLFQQRDDEEARSPKPLRRAVSAVANATSRSSSREAEESSSPTTSGRFNRPFSTAAAGASAPVADANRPKSTGSPKFGPKLTNPRSATNLTDQGRVTLGPPPSQQQQQRGLPQGRVDLSAPNPPVESPPAAPALPARRVAAIPPPRAAPAAPPKDLLGFSDSPQQQQQQQQQQQPGGGGGGQQGDWHAFVGLDHSQQQAQQQQQQQQNPMQMARPMQPAMRQPDPFAMQQQQPPRTQQQKPNNFDAFMPF